MPGIVFGFFAEFFLNSFKMRPGGSHDAYKCIKKGTLEFFGRPFGSESASRTHAEASDFVFVGASKRNLVDFGCHAGAHRILAGVPEVMVFVFEKMG